MIFFTSGGKLTLDDFEAPRNCCLRPVQFNKKRQRVTVRQGNNDITLSYIVNQDTGERHLVLPLDLLRVRMLILGLDEGSVRTAGVAAAAFHIKK